VKVPFNVLRIALLASAVAFGPCLETRASAESAAATASPVTLILDLDPGAPVDPERLRDAVARELRSPVTWQRGADGGTLIVRQAGGRVVVTFDGPDGRHDGRSIPLAGDPAVAERDITLLAGNVARDQTAEFKAVPPPPGPAQGPPLTAVTPASPGPSIVAAPLPVVRPSPCDPSGPRLAIGIDFAPWLGMSAAYPGAVRSVSLGTLGGLSGGVKGLSVNGVVDVNRGPLCGLQVSGVVNTATDTSGAQIAGVVNVARTFSGIQVAGVVNASRGDSSGIQVGAVNVTTGRVAGVQIGAVNYASDTDFQFGLVNINASGRLRLDGWAEPEMGLLFAGIKLGGRHYHWIYAVGIRPADAGRPWASLGFGAHLTPAKRLYVDLDLIDALQLDFASPIPTNLYEARAVAGFALARQLSLFAGPTYNVLASAPAARGGAPGYSVDLAGTSRPTYRAWPGVTVGVEGL
jgi:hypothetical protein